MTKYCSQCGKPNEKAAAFCYECGTPFEAETTVGPSFCGAFGYGLKNYFKFSGRATRAEYWGWLVVYWLMTALLCAAAVLLEQKFGLAHLYTKSAAIAVVAWGVLTLIPGLALAARRLHDASKSGWRLWIPILLIVGGCVAALYKLTGGTFAVDWARFADLEALKVAASQCWETTKTEGTNLSPLSYVALGCWGLAALYSLWLALRLCFFRGVQEANRYGDQQVNP